jgi:hypothetical protein
VRSEAVVSEFRSARADEYAEIARESERLLEHVARETDHRDFTFPELEELEADLGKLRRWLDQVRVRDYIPDATAVRSVEQLFARCEAALAEFLEKSAVADGAK